MSVTLSKSTSATSLTTLSTPMIISWCHLITNCQGLLYISIINRIELVSSSSDRVISAKFQKGPIDRTPERPGSGKNHTTCHAGYNIDEFPQLKNVNSQQAEQINRSLGSLATVLAHYKWETYLKVFKLFFVGRNMRMKKKNNKERCI